ncbi:phosphodiesterase [Vallitalea pronyensis]|uniref:Phosphoesterase n=1 Tax=Vallitalea pronyensis TaxID=1348613 RepID=A0A8J8MHE9_9FIRM|nr:phosphodiesterase [Vallitalea pronyensis]QUI21710.1 phosphodiesterase [Vallitalea pronyensis]
MKLMFVSDIHGSNYYADKAIEKFKEEKADYMVLLGDLLYHGPRNPLPKDYAPSKVLLLLNQYKDKIVAVRGNCDSEVDQMVLEFPMMSDYTIIFDGTRRIFATHGHGFNEGNMPPLQDGDMLIHGHTHIPVAKEVSGKYIMNPGSISLPKEDYPNSYGIWENNRFMVKDFDGHVIKSLDI